MGEKFKSESVALLLLFATFPTISFGTSWNSSLVWWPGLLFLIAGGLLPVWAGI
jgi:hypothetical protein